MPLQPLAFPCAARTYSDGTWYCAVCALRGDADEDVDDYCMKKAQNRGPRNQTDGDASDK